MNKENGESCKQRKKIHKINKSFSLAMKFGGSLLDFRDENDRVCCWQDVLC
jgi:predicted secreted acid phosphatase